MTNFLYVKFFIIGILNCIFSFVSLEIMCNKSIKSKIKREIVKPIVKKLLLI